MKRHKIICDSVPPGRVYGREMSQSPGEILPCYMNGMLENGVLERVFISGWS